MKPADAEDDIRKAFKIFDPESTGFIKIEELTLVLTTMGDTMSQQEIQDIINEAEKENDKIKFDSFVKLLCS